MKRKRILTLFTCMTAFLANNVWAECIGRGCFAPSGSCGTNCSYTLDDDGNLFITGNEGIIEKGMFSDSFVKRQIRNIYIDEGISEIQEETFRWIDIKSINIPESVTTLPSDFLFNSYSTSKIYCTSAQITNGICNNNYTNYYGRTTQTTHYEKKGNKYIVYSSFGEDKKIVGIYDDAQNMQKDIVTDSYKKENTQTGMTEVYNGRGILTSLYKFNNDGSVSIYDANGKLIGLQGKRILTVDEAMALVKDNKNTFKIKYR